MPVVTTTTNAIELWLTCCEVEIPAGTHPAVIREMDSRATSSLVKRDSSGKFDKSECYKYIKLALIYIADFFGGKFTDMQLVEMSKVMYAKFYYWRLLDWLNFKQKVCGLDYGKVYGQITPGQIIEFANQYNDDWVTSAEIEYSHTHDLIRKDDEKERSLEAVIREKSEAAIHRSAVDSFRERVISENAKKHETDI